MKQDAIRRTLINGAIHVIARDGLEKASAKQIETETGMNVVYIYRLFYDKEDLFAKMFESLDDELIDIITKNLPLMNVQEISLKERCQNFFVAIWRFLLGNQEKCRCYIRYYYSPLFKTYSIEMHKKKYQIVVETFRSAFRERANVWMILNHILNVMLDFAVKVCDGIVPDDEDTAEHVFRLVYASIRQYFKNEKEC